MRRFAFWGVCALVGLVLSVSAATAQSGPVVCPLKPNVLPTGGYVQWAFTDSDPPTGNAIKSSYVHGLGNWTNGRAAGTGCTMDALTTNGVVRNLILTIKGKSQLSPHVTVGGLLGVRIVLPVAVRASDDALCAVGTTGTITMFASYYSIHRDTMQIRFKAGCAKHSFSYSGSKLHVYIAHNGAQVNSA